MGMLYEYNKSKNNLRLHCFELIENEEIPASVFDLPVVALDAVNVRAASIVNFSTLRRLSLTVNKLSAEQIEEDLTMICEKLPELEALTIESAALLDLTSKIHHLRSLQELNILYTKMRGFPNEIQSLGMLRRIMIRNSQPGSLKALKNVINLRELVLSSCSLSQCELDELTGIRFLERFSFYTTQNAENRLVEVDLGFLKNCGRLRKLNIIAGKVCADSFRWLDALKELELSCRQLSSRELGMIMKCLVHAESLQFESADSKITIVPPVACSDSLRNLDLDFKRIDGIKALAGIKSLKKLSLRSEYALCTGDLKALVQLEELHCHGTKTENRPSLDAGVLSSLTQLKILDITRIDIADTVNLPALPALEELSYDMKRCPSAFPLDTSFLQKCTNLRKLDLSGASVINMAAIPTVYNQSPCSMVR